MPEGAANQAHQCGHNQLLSRCCRDGIDPTCRRAPPHFGDVAHGARPTAARPSGPATKFVWAVDWRPADACASCDDRRQQWLWARTGSMGCGVLAHACHGLATRSACEHWSAATERLMNPCDDKRYVRGSLLGAVAWICRRVAGRSGDAGVRAEGDGAARPTSWRTSARSARQRRRAARSRQ